MDDLQTRIRDLSDEDAVAVLTGLLDRMEVDWDVWQASDIQKDLPAALEDPDVKDEVQVRTADVGRGDLARTTLAYLAERHPELREDVTQAVEQPRAVGQRDLVALAVAGLVVLALQTEIELKRNDQGRWSFKLHKRPSEDSMLGEIIGKLAAFVGGGG